MANRNFKGDNENAGGIGFLGALCILFVGLKLTGHITWSWWWVLAPVWGPVALLLVLFLVMVVMEWRNRQ